jgi:antitoxin component of RelBE/YafQ-DinJ toxin-antitoxin module
VARALLTFRLDHDLRQRLKVRLASEGRTLSEVVTRELLEYVRRAGQSSGAGNDAADGTRVSRLADLALPEHLAARLRELRASGRSEPLSAALAALHDKGWPLGSLAHALGVSKQAVQARIRRSARAPAESGAPVPEAPAVPAAPAFPRRRSPVTGGRRPHLTIKIDQALRAAAHRTAAHEGSSLSQVVERILNRYLHHGLPGDDGPA